MVTSTDRPFAEFDDTDLFSEAFQRGYIINLVDRISGKYLVTEHDFFFRPSRVFTPSNDELLAELERRGHEIKSRYGHRGAK